MNPSTGHDNHYPPISTYRQSILGTVKNLINELKTSTNSPYYSQFIILQPYLTPFQPWQVALQGGHPTIISSHSLLSAAARAGAALVALPIRLAALANTTETWRRTQEVVNKWVRTKWLINDGQ